MKVISALHRLAGTPRVLANINEGIKNEADLLNEKLTEIKSSVDSANHGDALKEIKAAVDSANHGDILNDIRSSLKHSFNENVREPLKLDHPSDLPFPLIDMSIDDPISEIVKTFEYKQCAQMLAGRWVGRTSLMSEYSQALLYCTIRNMRPALVVEIGTYKAGSTKVIAWALSANGYGRLHTIDPFGGSVVPDILATWPPQLRRLVDFFPVNSMEYFAAVAESGEHGDLIFVDGNHDYEFALFDIEAAARVASPRGFIFVDNTSQAGPFLAAQDFMKRHEMWIECGGQSLAAPTPAVPFERRSPIPETDFCVMRGPAMTILSARPYTTGQRGWTRRSLRGVHLKVPSGPPGTLHVQCIIRTFGEGSSLSEIAIQQSAYLYNAGEATVELDADIEAISTKEVVYVTVEPWFVWSGDQPLAIEAWMLV